MIKKIALSVMALIAPLLLATAPMSLVSAATTCGTTKTQFIGCNSKTGTGTINDLIKITVIVMTVLIGIVATGGLAYAAILYSSARDNQSQVASAQTIIRNIVIGLLLYGFMLAVINWLLPGSVIG